MYSSHYGKLKMPFSHYQHPKNAETVKKNQKKPTRSQTRTKSKERKMLENLGDDLLQISVEEPKVYEDT